MTFRRVASIVLTLTALAGLALAELPTPPADHTLQHYADDELVAAMAKLARDADSLVREHAVCDLGETANRSALPVIRQALADDNALVRAAAIRSLNSLAPDQVDAPLAAAIGDDNRTVCLAALRLVRSGAGGEEARKAFLDLLSNSQAGPARLASCLDAMTARKWETPPATLDPLFTHTALTVRLGALDHAARVSPPSGESVDVLLRRAQDAKLPAAERAMCLRAAALASPGQAVRVANIWAKSSDAHLRRGAVWAYASVPSPDRLLPFLRDEANLVVLSAAEAVGTLGAADAFDDLADLLTSPADDIHAAAAFAMARIDPDATARRMAEWLGELASTAPADGNEKARRLWERNVTTANRVLAKLGSAAALDTQAKLLASLPKRKTLYGEVALAVGASKADRAADLLNAELATLAKRAARFLSPAGANVDFSDEATAMVAEAVGLHGNAKLAAGLTDVIGVKVASERLGVSAEAALASLAELNGAADSERVAKTVVDVLGDRDYRLAGIYYQAARTAGLLKVASATDLLRTHLTEKRQEINVMQAAAWALERITGKAPAIPAPMLYQDPAWILQKVQR